MPDDSISAEFLTGTQPLLSVSVRLRPRSCWQCNVGRPSTYFFSFRANHSPMIRRTTFFFHQFPEFTKQFLAKLNFTRSREIYRFDVTRVKLSYGRFTECNRVNLLLSKVEIDKILFYSIKEIKGEYCWWRMHSWLDLPKRSKLEKTKKRQTSRENQHFRERILLDCGSPWKVVLIIREISHR